MMNLFKGDLANVRAALTESVELSRMVGNQRHANANMGMLGLLAELSGDNVEAVRLTEECEKSYTIDLERHAVRAHLGRQLWKIGQRERGVEMLRNVLRAARPNVAQLNVRFENRCGVAALSGMANIACDLGDYTRAARLYGATDKMSEAVMRIESLRPLWESVAEVLRASLGEKAFDAECAEGASMTYQQAVDFALSETTSPQDSSLATVHQLLRSRGSARGTQRRQSTKAKKNRHG
jgi:hypothetical protein